LFDVLQAGHIAKTPAARHERKSGVSATATTGKWLGTCFLPLTIGPDSTKFN
jgi:hypothetical protein